MYHIIYDYKVVASIINCFYSKLYSDGENAHEIAIDMKNKMTQHNPSLDEYWNSFKDKEFVKVDANDIKDFPRLDFETLKNKITFGCYQFKK